MTVGARRRFRAPAEDDGVLTEPAANSIAAVLERNHSRQRQWPSFAGRSIADWSAAARQDLLAAAVAHTSRYRDLPQFPARGPLLLAGHQPQLFHPGVWFKNFLLSNLADHVRGAAINLIVDNDTQRSPTIGVPSGSLARPYTEPIAFDVPRPEMPFEERRIVDRDLWNSFPARVRQSLLRTEESPLTLDALAPHLRRATERTQHIGECFAEARHALEGEWGLRTLEVKLSTVCRQPTFRRFTLELLARANELQAIYNRALAEYRAANKLRSHSHPAPDLEADDSGCEAPFWLWSADDPQRRRLFVRTTPAGLELTDRGGVRFVVPVDDPAALETWEGRGIKVRPRAFVTTLFARIFLSDLFLHGIGGAKYDEVTDRICREFLGCEPPEYLTATATLRLPWGVSFPTRAHLDALVLKAWHLKHHPETFLADRLDLEPLVAEKRQLIASAPARKEGRERRRRITELNARLAEELAREQAEVAAAMEHTRGELRRAAILNSREISFVAYPSENLRRRLLDASII